MRAFRALEVVEWLATSYLLPGHELRDVELQSHLDDLLAHKRRFKRTKPVRRLPVEWKSSSPPVFG